MMQWHPWPFREEPEPYFTFMASFIKVREGDPVFSRAETVILCLLNEK
jgi:hypothetical protein